MLEITTLRADGSNFMQRLKQRRTLISRRILAAGLLANLASCGPAATRPREEESPVPNPSSDAAPRPASAGAASVPVLAPAEAYDTIAPASMRVNGAPLQVLRRDLIRKLGPPDSTFGFTDDVLACWPHTDSTAVYEVYDQAVYLRDGGRLRFMQSGRAGADFVVGVGAARIHRGTTLAALRHYFPLSARHLVALPDPDYQLLLVYPPRRVADDEQYEFVLQRGRVVQFKYTLICEQE